MAYTPAQHEAIFTHDRNLIVTAGAGSGKTRVLVDRFIAMLEANPDWPLPSLVAITFTEKAAREMRDRVRQAIEQRIEQATDSGADDEVRRWRDHQSALDSARIGTIHGLCTSILRANAAYVRIDPEFEVLEDIEASMLRADAIEQALSQVDESTAQLLNAYDVKAVQGVLHAMMGVPDAKLPGPIDYVNQWRETFTAYIGERLDTLCQTESFVSAVCWEPPMGWPNDPDDRMMQNWQLVIDARDTILSPEASTDRKLIILAEWANSIDLKGGSTKLWGKPLLDEAKVYLKFLRESAKEILADIGDFNEMDSQAAELLPAWGETIRSARAIYKALKDRKRALDFDDLETLTRELLHNPEVSSRYQGTEFRHVLVDEFQDTNSAQREIVAALADFQRPGSLFVVGDPRQSIYAFRGADVSVFSDVSQTILNSGGKDISLTTSFRTHRHLVDGFNEIFGALMTPGTGPSAPYQVQLGDPMLAHRESADGPCLELILIDKANATKGSSADDLRRWEAQTLALRLQALVENNTLVWDKALDDYRAIGYGDAAILFQSRKHMPIVEDAFKAANIPYVTISGKGYYNRPEVWDLLNLLKALYNPADDLSLASALRSPLYNLSDDDLFALRLQRAPINPATGKGERLSLWSALTDDTLLYNPELPDPEQVAFARHSLLRLSGVAGRVTIAELLTRALEETAFMATLSGLPDGSRRCGNVEKLIEVARRSGRISLGEFTLYLEDLTTIEAREGEAIITAQDAVQLMTVHASKGLEFPVVALFDSSFDVKDHPSWLIIDPVVGPACCMKDEDGKRIEPFAYRAAKHYARQREAAERIRLLYVAMTRAQDYVIVSGQIDSEAKESAKKGSGSWLHLLIETLGLPKTLNVDTDEEQLISMSWGDCLLRIPRKFREEEEPVGGSERTPAARQEQRQGAWDQLNGMAGQPIPGVQAAEPPMLAAVPVDLHAPTRLMSATEIAVLGEARATGKLAKFRHHVLRDAPPAVRDVARTSPGPQVSRRVIGEIVHQALRWGHFPGNTPNIREILDSYAWEQGITDPQMLEDAIQESTDLLERTERSSIAGQIREAQQLFRELPFTFQLGKRTINGVIDVLFLSKYGKWHIVDYKTSAVPIAEGEDRSAAIRAHAERYFAQVGIYAAAIEAMTGQAPHVLLHYIRYVYTVNVPVETWQEVLSRLDDDITQAISE